MQLDIDGKQMKYCEHPVIALSEAVGLSLWARAHKGSVIYPGKEFMVHDPVSIPYSLMPIVTFCIPLAQIKANIEA